MRSRRKAGAATRFFRKPLHGLQHAPRDIITDKLRRYAGAKRSILPGVACCQSRYLNNRAEVSHQPTRRCEWQRQRSSQYVMPQRFRPWSTLHSLTAPPSPSHRQPISRHSLPCISGMARDHRSCDGRIGPMPAATAVSLSLTASST